MQETPRTARKEVKIKYNPETQALEYEVVN